MTYEAWYAIKQRWRNRCGVKVKNVYKTSSRLFGGHIEQINEYKIIKP